MADRIPYCKEIATNIVNMIAADLMAEFPRVTKAILKENEWASFLDAKIEEVESILERRFRNG